MIDETSDPIVVAWRGVSKSYPGGFEALRDVSLDVRRGEVLALLGTSGSGKTTLLKLVNRLLDPTSGAVSVRGRATRDWDPIALRRSIGYVIQDVGLMPHLTISANVGLVPRLIGKDRAECERVAAEWLERVGLEPSRFAGLRPHQLSGGQRQRVGVARALAGEADLILMDEPFGALDPITRRELQDEFRALQAELRRTVIVVTHDLAEADRLADRLALLDAGRLAQCGTAVELRREPASAIVRDFFRHAEAAP